MKITDITPQVHNKQRKSIFVDGKYAFSLDETDCIKLKIGDSITEEQLNQLNIEGGLSKAKSKALDYLSRAPHTKSILIKKLKQKGYDEEIAKNAVTELEEMGLVDDREYAGVYVEMAKEKCYGPSKIRFELKSHGIDNEIIEEVMSSFDGNDIDELKHLILQKYRGQDFSDIKVRQKAVRFLLSRGFGFDVVNGVIGTLDMGE